MKRCRHGGETLKRARRLREVGRFAAALDDYLDVLADHPVETFCRRPILMEAAWLAYDLGCIELASAYADAAYQEAVLRRAEASALLILALVDARKGRREQAQRHLGEARTGARWSRSLRRRIGHGAVAIAVLADDTQRFDQQAPRGGSRLERALARLAYASALETRQHTDEAAKQFAQARTEFERLRPVRALRRCGRPSARRYRNVLAELGWAGAVAGQGSSAQGAELAATTLAARGLTDQAMRLNASLPAETRHNPSLCWYADATVVKHWSELVGGDPNRSWLTPEDAEALVTRLIEVFGRLRTTDPVQFTFGDRITTRTLALYGDRMGYPRLALEASRAELRLARTCAGTENELKWEQLAWVLRRQAVCLGDVGEVDGQIALLTEAAELYCENDPGAIGRDEVQRLGEKIVSLHLRDGDWAGAAAGTVTTQRRLASMTDSDPLPGIATALGKLHAKALNYASPGVVRSLVTERTEILRILARRDPRAFLAEHVDQLLAEVRSQPPATAPAWEVLEFARSLTREPRDRYAVLMVRILCEVARTKLPDRPDEALALLDDAIAIGPLPLEGAAEEAEAHRLRAASLGRLCRETQRVDALQREAEVILRNADSAVQAQRLLVIEDALWGGDRIDAALALLDEAIDAVTGDAGGLLRLRRAERRSELLRDAEAREDLAVVTERHHRLAARCRATYGLVHWRAERRDEAITAFDDALTLHAEQHYARHMRGVIRGLLGDSGGALCDLKVAASLRPGSWTTRAAWSLTYLDLMDNDASVREGHLAVDLCPQEAATHAAYGLALLAAGYRSEARNELGSAVAMHRASIGDTGQRETRNVGQAAALLNLPHLLVALGDTNEASRTMRAALATRPPPYLVWETATRLRHLAVTLPETAAGCAAILRLLAGWQRSAVQAVP
ncbi:MAG: hypothetical protein ACJ786_04235 [Catenulispora sp.]